MITGAHLVLFSTDPEADRTFLRTVLAWPSVGAGGPDDPWLIFGLPPAELAVHPAEVAVPPDELPVHPAEVAVHPAGTAPSIALYLLCDDLNDTMAALAAQGVSFTDEPRTQSWGTVTTFLLPSGARVGLYQPRHATPPQH